MKKILILGIGNVLMGDEGLGVRAVEALLEEGVVFPENVALMDGGTSGLSLLGALKGYTHVIIIDAVRGGGPPGTLYRFRGERIPPPAGLSASAHGIGVKDLLALMRFEGLKADVVIIGMEPERVACGLRLTRAVSERIPALAGRVKRELKKLGVNLGERNGHA